MDIGTILGYVGQGGDVAVYAVLYYSIKTNTEMRLLEIHQGYLKNRVQRLETKVNEVKHELA